MQSHIREQAVRIGFRPRPRWSLKTFDCICRLAADGAGVGIVPELAARRARRAMPLARVPLTEDWVARRRLLRSRGPADLGPLASALFHQLAAEAARARPVRANAPA